MERENIYQIKDNSLALEKVILMISTISIISGLVGFFLVKIFFNLNDSYLIGIVVTFIILGNLVSIKLIYVTWDLYSKGIIVDIQNNTFSFPLTDSDREYSILEYITLKILFDPGKRESLTINEIIALNNETKRWTTESGDGKKTKHIKYLLNVSGEFGSRQLEFTSQQKRDECRAILNNAKKKLNSDH